MNIGMTGDTVIMTNKGLYQIKNIVRKKMDVLVLSYNHETEQIELKKIKQYFENPYNHKEYPLLRLQFSRKDMPIPPRKQYAEEWNARSDEDKKWYRPQDWLARSSLSVTSNCPIYVVGKGYIPMQDVKVDDVCVGFNKKQYAVLGKMRVGGRKDSYNVFHLEIENNFPYFASGILVDSQRT